MARKTAFFFAFALSAFLAYPQAVRGGLIEGDTWAFLVSAPEGWVWDKASLRNQGIQGLFHKAGDKYSPSGLHMYISPARKGPEGPSTLSEFIESDEAGYMKATAGNVVSNLAPYSPGMGYGFVLRDFDDRIEGNYQAIAYYEGDGAYFIFVLFCRSARERDRERPSFLELLDSFTYINRE